MEIHIGTEDGPYRFLDLVGKVINRIDEIEPMYYGLPALISSLSLACAPECLADMLPRDQPSFREP